ncbi:MAG: phage tail sheath family protein [Myxococcales bacterium]|nr:phage tail sheath family protein [Myxococcales bacterium]
MGVTPETGPPGLYFVAESPAIRAVGAVRMDIAAFVGVAPRGPARVPVVEPGAEVGTKLVGLSCVDPARPLLRSVPVFVNSWAQYQQLFGGFEGPGALPFAVWNFFASGGQAAYVVRIVHDYGDPTQDLAGFASADLPGVATLSGDAVGFRARNEGSWGNSLSVQLEFRVAEFVPNTPGAGSFSVFSDVYLPVGTLIRATAADGTQQLRFVTLTYLEGLSYSPDVVRVITLNSPFGFIPVTWEIVTADVRIEDGAGRSERFSEMGFMTGHPRFLADVLCAQSQLVWPKSEWAASELLPGTADLRDVFVTDVFAGGADRYKELKPADFFDANWVPGNEEPGAGITCLAHLSDLSLVCAPDLYVPEPKPPADEIVEDATFCGADFAPHIPKPKTVTPKPVPEGLVGLYLSPEIPDDLAEIISLQTQLVDTVAAWRTAIVMLDVPPGLDPARIEKWRRNFRSEFSAAYHPWLRMAHPERSDELVTIHPSAVACGIVARTEKRFGVQHGPSNELVVGAVGTTMPLTESLHGRLHRQAINCYVQDPAGIRLTGARTLSLGSAYRQLSVRRLVTMIIRALDRQLQWTVFEPNDGRLQSAVKTAIAAFLRSLYRANAFVGATEEEAFFVRCDKELNIRSVVDEGRMLAEVGIAPAEPLEFIVVRIARDPDGRLQVEA